MLNHSWRRNKHTFVGKEEHRSQLVKLISQATLEQVHMVSRVQFGKGSRKKKRALHELNWIKKSIFFYLPYCPDLELRQNLDVIHIEKNICDSILGTMLSIDGKSKDIANARRDLANL